jgi:hypothetical protein
MPRVIDHLIAPELPNMVGHHLVVETTRRSTCDRTSTSRDAAPNDMQLPTL